MHSQRFSLSRPRHQLSHRAGGGAQAQRDFLHPRRRLSRRRDEAWADRLDRRENAGGRAGAARPLFPKNREQPKRSRVARRQSHRPHRRCQDRQRKSRAFRVLTLPKASHYLTPIVMTIPLQLLAYHIAVHARHGRRSAAQSRQERHGRIMALCANEGRRNLRDHAQLAQASQFPLALFRHQSFPCRRFHPGHGAELAGLDDDQLAVFARRGWLLPGVAATCF